MIARMASAPMMAGSIVRGTDTGPSGAAIVNAAASERMRFDLAHELGGLNLARICQGEPRTGAPNCLPLPGLGSSKITKDLDAGQP